MIPNQEPVVSVGIHLPQDKFNATTIAFPDPELYEININGIPISIQSELKLQVKDGYIEDETASIVNISQLCIFRKDQYVSARQGLIIHSVVAGRGFHWQKEISVQLPGHVIIEVRDDSLFTVNEVLLEQYLMCVAASEMSANCPGALLEVQTIVARSWILAASEQKHIDLGLDVCNDDCCQRYQGIGSQSQVVKKVSLNTRGKVLIANEQICDTRYSKCCGGRTEDNELVWKTKPKSYLRSVYDGPQIVKNNLSDETVLKSWVESQHGCYCGPKYVSANDINEYLGEVDKIDNYYRWSVHYIQIEIVNLISEKTRNYFDSISALIPILRGKSGRIMELRIDGIVNGDNSSLMLKSEYEIRRVLHPDFLYSSAFIIETNLSGGKEQLQFILRGAGWGHGVGLCQIGALGMAIAGYDLKTILAHYYQASELINIYD